MRTTRLAELAGWDKDLLRVELQHLLTLDLNFDVPITGFEVPEIDLIVNLTQAEADTDGGFISVGELAAVSRMGDLWQLGRHRILCGDFPGAGQLQRGATAINR